MSEIEENITGSDEEEEEESVGPGLEILNSETEGDDDDDDDAGNKEIDIDDNDEDDEEDDDEEDEDEEELGQFNNKKGDKITLTADMLNINEDSEDDEDEPPKKKKKSERHNGSIDPHLKDFSGSLHPLNIFRRAADWMSPFLRGSEFYIQARNMLISVPSPTFNFDSSKISEAKEAEQEYYLDVCKHEFKVVKEQMRSGDEAITVLKICQLCGYTQKFG